MGKLEATPLSLSLLCFLCLSVPLGPSRAEDDIARATITLIPNDDSFIPWAFQATAAPAACSCCSLLSKGELRSASSRLRLGRSTFPRSERWSSPPASLPPNPRSGAQRSREQPRAAASSGVSFFLGALALSPPFCVFLRFCVCMWRRCETVGSRSWLPREVLFPRRRPPLSSRMRL